MRHASLILAGVLAASPAAAQVTTTVADSPQPQPAKAAGISPRMHTEITKEGWCVVTANSSSPSDPKEAQIAAHQACLDTLIHKRPVPLLQTPGSFFLGYAWGKKSNQFVYGPQVGVGAAVLFPLHRPSLRYQLAPADGATGNSRTWTFSLPEDMTIAADLAVSLNANLASFTFPNAPATSSQPEGPTEQTFNASLYLAPQIGWVWWDGGAKRVMFSLGLMAGYINTDATGKAFVLGVQPGLVAQF